ncbi:helix-turn-helix transcriptional regulator [Frateuria sp. GZRR33]|uniref:helix-turn-helix transcriptional regulator n=1 Tax=Frateuria sp. GZRR33 TaxID=3351535 RepID=UPI003EDC919E
MQVVETTGPRILRIKEVQGRIGFGRSTIYNLINPRSSRFDPMFPLPVKLGATSIGWIESEVSDWIRSRANARARQQKGDA